MIASLLKKSPSRGQTAGNRPSAPGTFHRMMADEALHVCSVLLTVSGPPIPPMPGLEKIEGSWQNKR